MYNRILSAIPQQINIHCFFLPPQVRDRAVHFDSTGRHFIVEGKEKLILSGAVHYFRVVPAYWEDRLLRLKAAGLNTVETYVHDSWCM